MPSSARARLVAVVVNFRTPAATVECVRALGASLRKVDEILVVDNGSGDGSVEELRRKIPSATLVALPVNRGFSGGVNAGIAKALATAADLVLLVNSDAIVDSRSIDELEQALGSEGELGIVGPVIVSGEEGKYVESEGIRFSSLTGRVWNLGFGTLHVPRAARVIRVDAISGCVMLITRNVFERIGLFSEEYFFSFEDVDFCLRARRAGLEAACVTGAHTRHVGSLSIGSRSPDRIYYASRNHLLLLDRAAERLPFPLTALRAACVVGLNLAHALSGRRAAAPEAFTAFAQGVRDHLRDRYGARRPTDASGPPIRESER